MRKGEFGEIYLQALDKLQEVMIPRQFTHTKRDVTRYLRTHFSKSDVKKLSLEMLGKKSTAEFSKKSKVAREVEHISDEKRKKLLGKIKTIATVLEDFQQNAHCDTDFSAAEVYAALFNSQIKLQSLDGYRKDLEFAEYTKSLETNDITFDIENNLDYSLMKNLLISYGNPERLERSGTATYKQLLKEKHISNKCTFPLTKTCQKILRLFNNDLEFILSLDIYSALTKNSIGSIRKNLNNLISMGILCREQAGKYWAYQRIG